MYQIVNETMKGSYSISSTNSTMSDLLWISKQQQQHPLTHIHPLKNTIRLNSQGQRCKFDGRQWRPLCESHDGIECRNLAFRSALCQKHFYKIHLFKRSYVKNKSEQIISLKRSLLTKYEQQLNENNDSISQLEDETESKISLNHLHNPPLTRTEEKSLVNELIFKLPLDISFEIAEQIARHRVCEIIFDNYSQQISSENIINEWFYDFLLRNPRLPIHFQSWFAMASSTLPTTDHMIDIKIWQLGLVTRSVLSSS